MENIVKIDIEKLMNEIHENINSRDYDDDILSFQEIKMAEMDSVISKVNKFSLEELEQNICNANERYNVQAYRYLHSHRPVIGKCITFMKKGIRKICKFYVEPIVEDQNGFNISMMRTCNQLLAYVKETQIINEQLQLKIYEIEKKIDNTDK